MVEAGKATSRLIREFLTELDTEDELRAKFHALIDTVNDGQILLRLYEASKLYLDQ